MSTDLRWRVEQVAFDHPDAELLIEEVQLEYVRRYGGRDDTPLEAAYFEPPRGSFYVGYVDDQPVATGAWRIRTDVAYDDHSPVAEIKRMYVQPRMQRLGLARRMLAHLERTALSAGVPAMVLETGLEQPEAIALYRSSGYADMTRFGYYQDYDNAVYLGKVLLTSR